MSTKKSKVIGLIPVPYIMLRFCTWVFAYWCDFQFSSGSLVINDPSLAITRSAWVGITLTLFACWVLTPLILTPKRWQQPTPKVLDKGVLVNLIESRNIIILQPIRLLAINIVHRYWMRLAPVRYFAIILYISKAARAFKFKFFVSKWRPFFKKSSYFTFYRNSCNWFFNK